ncbi:MAG: SUMF1/EgtB/PvdO family nonheme iron enzyme [Sedimenticola sp.]
MPQRDEFTPTMNEVCQKNGVLALETDASGVADAAWDQTEISDYIIVRGIAGYEGDTEVDPAWRRYASLAAASCLRALLDLQPFPSQARMKSHVGDTAQARHGNSTDHTTQLERYLEWLAANVGDLTVRVPDAVLSAPVETAYVGLNVLASNTVDTSIRDESSEQIGEVDFLSLWPVLDGTDTATVGWDIGGSTSTTPATTVLGNSPAAVIVGEPGSGKTTILRFLAHRLATALLAGEKAEEALGIVGDVPIPIFMSLNAYAEHVSSLPADAPPEARSLLRFAARYPEYRHAYLNLDEDFFERILQSGRPVALLLDGLDEVVQPDLQLLVGGTLEDLTYVPLPLSILTTVRASAYRGTAVLSQRFQRYRLPLLPRSQIDSILERMTDVFEKETDTKEGYLSALRASLESLETRRTALRGSSQQLVTTPLMARVLFTLHFHQGRVPAQRSEFLSDYIDVALDVSYHPDTLVALRLVGSSALRPVHRRILRRLAFESHLALEAAENTVSRTNLHALVCDEIRGSIHGKEVDAAAEQIIAALTQRAGLVSVDRHRVKFNHLAFQEVLVGEYLAAENQAEGNLLSFLGEKNRIGMELWHDPAGHAIAFVSKDDIAEASRIVKSLLSKINLGKVDEQARRLAILGESCVERTFGRKLDSQVGNAICELLFGKPSLASCEPELAARLGTLLGHLGDPRLNDEKSMMVDVEAGEFFMGHPPAPELVDLPSIQSGVYRMSTGRYRIAKKLTTNAEYSRFVEAGGYEPRSKKFWSTDGWKWKTKHDVITPAFWDDATWTCPNHPVVGISWFEASAFCRWLSSNSGRRFRLPTEAEWERAAQGRDKSLWPWGDTRDYHLSNTLEFGLGRTTCVGLFPEGASKLGLLDASGNVWEWCNSEYRTYAAYSSSDGREAKEGNMPRCIRGGSWLNNLDRARVANRDHYSPGDRHSDLGFRLAEDWSD